MSSIFSITTVAVIVVATFVATRVLDKRAAEKAARESTLARHQAYHDPRFRIAALCPECIHDASHRTIDPNCPHCVQFSPAAGSNTVSAAA